MNKNLILMRKEFYGSMILQFVEIEKFKMTLGRICMDVWRIYLYLEGINVLLWISVIFGCFFFIAVKLNILFYNSSLNTLYLISNKILFSIFYIKLTSYAK